MAIREKKNKEHPLKEFVSWLIFLASVCPLLWSQATDTLRLSVYVEENRDLQKQLASARDMECAGKTSLAITDYKRLLTQVGPETVQPFLFLPANYLQQLAKASQYFRELDTATSDNFPLHEYVPEILRLYPSVVIVKQDIQTVSSAYRSEGMLGLERTLCGWMNSGLYSGTAEYVRSRLAALPMSEFSAAQQLEYEKINAEGRELSQTTDADALQNFLTMYPLSDKKLWLTLGDLYAAKGKWDRAIGAWKRMQLLGFSMHRQERLALAIRLAYASRLYGDLQSFEELQHIYQSEQTRVEWMGSETPCAQVFSKMATLPSSLPGEQGWPEWKGNSAHNAALARFDFHKKFVKTKIVALPGYPDVIQHPVAWQKWVYYQFPGEIVCVDVTIPKVAWRFSLPQTMAHAAGIHPENKISTGVIANGFFYSFSSHGIVRNIAGDTLNLGNTIHCLNARTGDEIWRWPTADNGDNVIFNGIPVVLGDRLYAAATVIKGQFSVELFCLHTGAALENPQPRLLWRRFVCSYLPNAEEKTTMEVGASGLTACYGLIYCVSNLGVVAAVDMENGEVRWLAKYHQHFTQKYRLRSPKNMLNRNMIWHFQPPIAKHGRLYVVPNDAKAMFVYNAFSGALHKIFPESQENREWNHLIAVAEDGKIFVGGTSAVAALDDGLYQEMVWKVQMPFTETIQGIGVWAGPMLYVPTMRGIFEISTQDGKMQKVLGVDAVKSFQRNSESPVSLLVVPYAGKTYLVVSAKSSLTVYKN
jgi:outer membrane protein assembly factor BamB